MKRLFDDVTDSILSAHLRRETEFIMNYLLFSLKILCFHCRLMVSLSIDIILYIIEKLRMASFQWDVNLSAIPTHSIRIHFLI